jgi:hypothetical protein
LAEQPAAIAIGSCWIERAKAKSSGRIAMPRGGSKPGERRGGRQKGTPNRKTLERRLITERMLEHPSAGVESGRLGRDVLAQYMCTFDELAEQYRKTNEPKFRQYAELAVACAKALAPYQSPTYRAIVVSSPQQEGNGARLELTREELARKLEERGLPPFVFGIDQPTPETEPRRIEGNGSSEPED